MRTQDRENRGAVDVGGGRRDPRSGALARGTRSRLLQLPGIPHSSVCSPHAHAFTLLELLLVLSIMAILASITFVVGRSISERSKVAQARSEMAVLAAALEQYKQQYGDYPCTPDPGPDVDGYRLDGGAILFNALCGNLGPRATQLLDADGNPRKGRTFVDLARFTLASTAEERLPKLDDPELKVNWFNDPWGEWYWYYYKKTPGDAAWRSKGYLLYSHGPDGECRPGPEEDSGLLEDQLSTPEAIQFNRDNIYHGRD